MSRGKNSSLEIWFQLVISIFTTSIHHHKLGGTHSRGGVENKKPCLNYKRLAILC